MREKCLRVVYNSNASSFEGLLEINNSISVHRKNIQFLATKLYQIVNELSPNIMKDIFPLNNNLLYNNRNRGTFHPGPIRSVTYGSETLFHFA